MLGGRGVARGVQRVLMHQVYFLGPPISTKLEKNIFQTDCEKRTHGALSKALCGPVTHVMVLFISVLAILVQYQHILICHNS